MRKAIKVLISLILIINAVTASWKVGLHPTQLMGKIVVNSVASEIQADELHVSTIQLGTGDFSKKVDAIFDTTTLTNWFIDEQTNAFTTLTTDAEKRNIYSCKPPCKWDDLNGVPITFPAASDNLGTPLPTFLRIFGDRFQLTPHSTAPTVIGRNATDKVVFSNKQTVSNIPFLVPNEVSFYPTTGVALSLKSLVKTTAAFGLGHPEYVDRHQNNFVDKINSNGERLQQKGFSFYIHQTISQVIFGEPEKFFGDQPQAIRNLEETGQYWRTKMVMLKVAGTPVGRSEPINCRVNVTDTASAQISYPTSLPCTFTTGGTPPGEAHPYAIFDSTSKFIYAPKGQIDILVEVMGLRDSGRTFRFNDTVNLYEAPCQQEDLDQQFPELEFFFFEVEKPFKVKGSDYVTYDHTKTSKNCWLNIKPNIETNPPSTTYSKYIWYLGTTFLRANYCHFDQNKNFINCSPAYRFTPLDLHIGDQARIVALVIGALLLVGALAILISLFTKVPPFQASSVPTASPTRSQNFELGRTKIERSLPPPQNQFNPYNSQFGGRNY